MEATDWWATGTQLAVAIATLVLAAFTAFMAKRTREVAEEARKQVTVAGEAVEAARQEAQATESLVREAELARQLQWRPQLEVNSYSSPQASDQTFNVMVKNNGAGPALRVVSIGRLMENVGTWALAHHGDILQNGGQSNKREDAQHGGPSLTSPFDGPLGAARDDVPVLALFCQDVLDRQFRFVYSKPAGSPSTLELKRHPAEIAVGDPLPQWAAEPLIWE